MALTPQEVANKQFTTVRFKEGYDLDEVDNFLDEVELTLNAMSLEVQDLRSVSKGTVPDSVREEVRSLGVENSRLKSELDQAQRKLQGAQVRPGLTNDIGANDFALKASQDRIAALEAQIDSLKSMQAEQAGSGTSTTASEQGVASVRILELAQRAADDVLASARIEAENMLAETKTNVIRETRDLDAQRVSMERRVEELRAYEREYRGRLRNYLEAQLRELDSNSMSGDRQGAQK
jgi:DivIVA domain-containing protein